MALIGRWWIGRWGRLTRRDIWLTTDTRWVVRARQGTADASREKTWHYATETDAREMVDRLMEADATTSAWKDLTQISRPNRLTGRD